jgi:hypothetical protein
MKNLIYLSLIIGTLIIESCSDNPQGNANMNNYLVYEKPGLLDSITGTCSTFLIRNFTLDTLNFSDYNKAVLERNSFTDGDLSEIIIYYLNSDTAVNVLNLQGKGQINSAEPIEFYPPKRNETYYLRMKLYSSVCTGQFFHLKLRDVKIYGMK